MSYPTEVWKESGLSAARKLFLGLVLFALVTAATFVGSYLSAQLRHDACEQRNADKPPAIAVGGISDPNYRLPEDCGP